MTKTLIEKVRIGLPDSHSDARRTIADVYRRDLQSDIITNIAASGRIKIPLNPSGVLDNEGRAVLGNHYHERKDELFDLPYGRAIVHLLDLDSQENLELPLDANSSDLSSVYLFVPRRTVHTFRLEPGAVLYHFAINIDSQYSPVDAKDNLPHTLFEGTKK